MCCERAILAVHAFERMCLEHARRVVRRERLRAGRRLQAERDHAGAHDGRAAGEGREATSWKEGGGWGLEGLGCAETVASTRREECVCASLGSCSLKGWESWARGKQGLGVGRVGNRKRMQQPRTEQHRAAGKCRGG
eukprot:1690649-Pleurochrysis_carterae.AAC.3